MAIHHLNTKIPLIKPEPFSLIFGLFILTYSCFLESFLRHAIQQNFKNNYQMKYYKIASWFLALSMSIFGILKFIHPFKTWYSVQISQSELGSLAYPLGIAGEIMVGLTLLICLNFKHKISTSTYKLITGISFFAIIMMMLTGIYVHLHPNVSADVLPLKIKPPYIPAFFLILAACTMLFTVKKDDI